MTDYPPVLCVDEVASLLRVNRKTVYEMVQRKQLPGVQRCGRALRFSRDTVIAWLANGQGRAQGKR